jgi:RNA polymerase sigma-70 factor (ECF subfamily)
MAGRHMRQERQDHTLDPGALVNELYLRLCASEPVNWQNRAHFFATTARMMRRVLVDAARARRSVKRGGGVDAISFEGLDVAAPELVDVLALEDALMALATVDPRPSQVIELRFFGGFSVEETAEALGVSVRTVINDWNTARAWLRHELTTRDTG